jgi:hypothetical protein
MMIIFGNLIGKTLARADITGDKSLINSNSFQAID